jgi:hypothetical protein
MNISSLKDWQKFSSQLVTTETTEFTLLQTYSEWLEENPSGYVCDQADDAYCS